MPALQTTWLVWGEIWSHRYYALFLAVQLEAVLVMGIAILVTDFQEQSFLKTKSVQFR